MLESNIHKFKELRERIESELKELTNEQELEFKELPDLISFFEEDITQELNSKCEESHLSFKDNKIYSLSVNPHLDEIKKEIRLFETYKQNLNFKTPFLSFLKQKYSV